MKNKTWDLITLFWTDGKENSDRLRNTIFTIEKNKFLVDYINKNGGKVNYRIYDFSPEKMIDEAIHIPYPLSVYKRSEKINIALKNSTAQFFSIIDGDCFFDEEEFPSILELYKNLDPKKVYNFDWKKISYEKDVDFEKRILLDKNAFDYAIGHNRTGGLGAFFIVSTKALKKIGGFDPSFITWGGEDNEVLERLLVTLTREEIKYIAPYHLPHFTEWDNKLYYDRE